MERGMGYRHALVLLRITSRCYMGCFLLWAGRRRGREMSRCAQDLVHIHRRDTATNETGDGLGQKGDRASSCLDGWHNGSWRLLT